MAEFLNIFPSCLNKTRDETVDQFLPFLCNDGWKYLMIAILSKKISQGRSSIEVHFGNKVKLKPFILVQVIEINLSSMAPYVSGPKRPQDRVAVSSMKEDFQSCLDEKVT